MFRNKKVGQFRGRVNEKNRNIVIISREDKSFLLPLPKGHFASKSKNYVFIVDPSKKVLTLGSLVDFHTKDGQKQKEIPVGNIASKTFLDSSPIRGFAVDEDKTGRFTLYFSQDTEEEGVEIKVLSIVNPYLLVNDRPEQSEERVEGPEAINAIQNIEKQTIAGNGAIAIVRNPKTLSSSLVI